MSPRDSADSRELNLGDGPRLGLGLASLGRPGYINLGHAEDLGGCIEVGAMRERACAVLDYAYDAGLRYFDAARSYGRAEEFLGSWLERRGLQPSAVAVGSKWGYIYTANWTVDAEVHEVKELTAANFGRQRDETLALLGPWLRLYQIHSATIESGVLDDVDVIARLVELRDRTGTALGLSVSGPRQAEAIERAVAVGAFDSVQATWNPLDPSAGVALAAAHDAGLKVIVKEAVANGRLTARGEGEAAELLRAEAEQLGVGMDAVALAVVLAQPWADMVLSGASTVEMLRSNLAALQITPGQALLDRLTTVAMSPEDYWQARSALPWN